MSFEERVPYSGLLIHANGRRVKCTGQVTEIDGGQAYTKYSSPIIQEELEDGSCQMLVHNKPPIPGRIEGGKWLAQR